MSTKDKLVQNVKDWLINDKEIKTLQSQIKERKKKKTELTELLVNIMKSNEIDCVDITGGKILYSQNKVKSALNKKHLMDSLEKYFENNSNVQTEELSKFILNSRNIKTTESIRHKANKT